MRTSERNNAILPALGTLQFVAMEGVAKSGTNPMFKSQYMKLDDILHGLRDGLNDTRCIITHDMAMLAENTIMISTRITHTPSGEWAETQVYIPMEKHNAHGAGSAITYGRRYGLMQMLGLPGEDDDGNAAVAPQKKTRKTGVGSRGGVYTVAKEKWPKFLEALNKCDDADAVDKLELHAKDNFPAAWHENIADLCDNARNGDSIGLDIQPPEAH